MFNNRSVSKFQKPFTTKTERNFSRKSSAMARLWDNLRGWGPVDPRSILKQDSWGFLGCVQPSSPDSYKVYVLLIDLLRTPNILYFHRRNKTKSAAWLHVGLISKHVKIVESDSSPILKSSSPTWVQREPCNHYLISNSVVMVNLPSWLHLSAQLDCLMSTLYPTGLHIQLK